MPADLVRLCQDVQNALWRLRNSVRHIAWLRCTERAKQLFQTLVDKEPRVTLPGVVGGDLSPRSGKLVARGEVLLRQCEDALVRLVMAGEQGSRIGVTLGHAQVFRNECDDFTGGDIPPLRHGIRVAGRDLDCAGRTPPWPRVPASSSRRLRPPCNPCFSTGGPNRARRGSTSDVRRFEPRVPSRSTRCFWAPARAGMSVQGVVIESARTRTRPVAETRATKLKAAKRTRVASFSLRLVRVSCVVMQAACLVRMGLGL